MLYQHSTVSTETKFGYKNLKQSDKNKIKITVKYPFLREWLEMKKIVHYDFFIFHQIE